MHRPEYFPLVDVRRQWQLHEYAVHVTVRIPTTYPIEQRVLGDDVCVGIRLEERRYARVGARPLLHSDVGGGIGAIANEHDGESRPAAIAAAAASSAPAAIDDRIGEFERELGSYGVRDGLAIDDATELRLRVSPHLVAFGPLGTPTPPDDDDVVIVDNFVR